MNHLVSLKSEEVVVVTDGQVTLLFIVAAALHLFSFFFSGMEVAFPTVNRLWIQKDVENKKKLSKTVLKLAEDFHQVTSIALFGNALVNIATSSITTLIGLHYGGEQGAAIAAIIVFVTLLTFGEILPKTVCLKFSYRFSYLFAIPVMFFNYLFFPITFTMRKFLSLITGGIKKAREDEIVDKDVYSEDELQEMVNEIEESGLIDEDKSELIKSAIEFSETEAYEIMTPRVDVFSYDIEDDISELIEQKEIFKYSRIPVYEGTIDNIIGILPTKLLLRYVLSETPIDVRKILRPPYFVHHSKGISDLLNEFKEQETHIAIVIDEYGGTEGIITIEDIIEEIVGEIWDESDEVDEPVVELGEDHYLIDGGYNLEDFFELLDIEEDEETDYDTVGGWCLDQLDRFAVEGDEFTYEGYQITITEVGAFTVEEIEVKRNPNGKEEREE